MKNVLLPILVLAVVQCAVGQTTSSKSETLGSIKHAYLNQRVVLRGYVGSLGGPRLLMEWQRMKRVGDEYVETSTFDYLPEDYLGKAGTVVAIQLVHSQGQKTNALGEVISEDETTDPYFELIVQLDDGVLARTTAYPNTLSLNLQLAGEFEELRQNIAKSLPQLIGKNVYAVGYSHLYQPDSTLEEMTGQQEILKRLSLLDTPLLEPIQVLDAKYIGDGIVLKLKLPNGNLALSYTSGDLLRIFRNRCRIGGWPTNSDVWFSASGNAKADSQRSRRGQARDNIQGHE